MTSTPFQAGQRVAVTQQIAQRAEAWTQRVEGVVEKFERRKTGSWFAHSRDDKLWLDRLTLRKDDGEVVVCNLDRYSRVDVLGAATATPGAGGAATGEAGGAAGGGEASA